MEDEGIEFYRTRGHPVFAERFKRTFEDKLFKMVENDDKEEILLTYNNKDVHSATGLTPNEARKDRNEFKTKSIV